MFSNLGATELLVMAVGAILLIFVVTRLAKFFFRILLFVAFIAAIWYFLGGKGKDFFSGNTNNPATTTTTTTTNNAPANNQPSGKTDSFFDNTSISELWKKTCSNGTATDAKCACVVVPIYNDIRTRYTELGLTDLEESQVLMLNEMRKSLKKTYPQIETCLKQRGSEGLKFLEVLKKF